MSIVTELKYGRYTITLNPSPDPFGKTSGEVVDSEMTVYDSSKEVVLIADVRGTEIQMQRYAESHIDTLLPCCPCNDEQPVKPGYKLCWDCMDIVAANGIDEDLYHT